MDLGTADGLAFRTAVQTSLASCPESARNEAMEADLHYLRGRLGHLDNSLDPSQYRDEDDNLLPSLPAPTVTDCLKILKRLSSYMEAQLQPPPPSLPVEIVDRILSFLDGEYDRVPTLVRSSLVNKTWHSLIRPRLYRSVSIQSRREADALLQALNTAGTEKMVRHLEIRENEMEDYGMSYPIYSERRTLSQVQLSNLLKRVSALETLDVSHGTGDTSEGYCHITAPTSLRSIALGCARPEEFNLLHYCLNSLTHINWDCLYTSYIPPTLVSASTIVSLDLFNPSATLPRDLGQHLLHLRRLSLPRLRNIMKMFEARNWGDLDKWVAALRSLSSVEELALQVPWVGYVSPDLPDPQLIILRSLPINLRYLIYASQLDHLRMHARQVALLALTDTNHPLPSTLRKINFTVDKATYWDYDLEEHLDRALRGADMLDQFRAREIEVVVGESWRSSWEDGVGAYDWDIDEYWKVEGTSRY